MAMDRVRFAGTLAHIVAGPKWKEDLPKRLCVACSDALPVDGVGLTLMMHDQPDKRVLLGASDSRAVRIEDLQFSLGEGPCVSAFVTGRPVLVPDVEATDVRVRWPIFMQEAAIAGIGAVFAFPLQMGAVAIGVLDCYRLRPGQLREVAEVLAVTDAVMAALLNARSADSVMSNIFDLSWRGHAAVHQATGLISAAMGISIAEALVRLRAYAFRYSQSLDVVAGDVLAGRVHLSR
jgi:GAF domain-containing protein